MNSQFILIVKILLVSTMISVFIKYGSPLLAIAPTNTNALIGILCPPLALGLLLGWRAKNTRRPQQKSSYP
jgi:hypothetical protein